MSKNRFVPQNSQSANAWKNLVSWHMAKTNPKSPVNVRYPSYKGRIHKKKNQ